MNDWSIAGHHALLSLFSGYSSRYRSRKGIAMLQAYVDDSKQLHGKNIFMAGFVSSAENWLHFSDAWDAELKAYPSIEYFKCSEWKAKRKQFRNFGKLDREIKASRLCEVINDHSLWSFQISVNEKDVRQVFDDSVPYGIRTPYFLLFMGVVVGLARYQLEMGNDSPIDVIFDEQNQIQRLVSAIYGGLKEMQPNALQGVMGGQPVFRSDRDVLPLQAADLLAWHAQKFTRDGEIHPKGFIAENVFRSNKHFYQHIDRSNIESMHSQLLTLPNAKKLSKKNEWAKTMREIENLIAGGVIPF
jgi:uncharacterized C2H2 Zn-finger protein